MSSKITVLNPQGFPPEVTGKRLAQRLESLDGKTVYLVDCLFDNSDVFMQQLDEWFGTHFPKARTQHIKPTESWKDDAAMRAQIEAHGDAAILGVGL
jgi:hypothetical protein